MSNLAQAHKFMKEKILNTIGSNFTPRARKILSESGQVDYLDIDQVELMKIINQYDVALIGLGLNFNKEIISKGKKLKLIATVTTGIDHIDNKFALGKGVDILSLKNETIFLNTITGTAELAFGLLLDLLKHISASYESVKNYRWEREKFIGNNLGGKVLGVVGYGRLGKMMARYGLVFGMKVLVDDPNVSADDLEKGMELVNWGNLLQRSDIISIHVHLDEGTKSMFNKHTFQQMKSTAYLINTARGQIVNEDDVLLALQNEQLAGYATDVLAGENNFNKVFSNYPLVEYAKNHQNCIIVPHIGGMTYESREATDIFMAEKVVAYLKNFRK